MRNGWLARLWRFLVQLVRMLTLGEMPPGRQPGGKASVRPAPGKAEAAHGHLVDVAKEYIGVMEEGGPNKGPQVERFQRAVDGKAQGEPWCMSFVQFCIKEVEKELGVESQIFRSEHVVTTWLHTPTWLRSEVPEPGSLLMLRRPHSTRGHVGIVTEVFAGGEFATVEGNTNITGQRKDDGVFEKRRSTRDSETFAVLGFIRPFDKAMA